MRILLAVLWTAFIVYGLASEPSGMPRFPWLAKPGVDKVVHAILFLLEAAFLVFALTSLHVRKRWFLVLAWCLFLGGGLEIVQHYWIKGRTGDVNDLLADMFGAALGVLIIEFILSKRNKFME